MLIMLCRSKLLKKSPEIYNKLNGKIWFAHFYLNVNIEGVSVDFYNRDDDILDPYSHLHSEEERLVSESPLQVSQAAMLLNIRDVFSQSKPGRTNEKASELSVWLCGCHNVTQSPVTSLHNVSDDIDVSLNFPFFLAQVYFLKKNVSLCIKSSLVCVCVSVMVSSTLGLTKALSKVRH